MQATHLATVTCPADKKTLLTPDTQENNAIIQRSTNGKDFLCLCPTGRQLVIQWSPRAAGERVERDRPDYVQGERPVVDPGDVLPQRRRRHRRNHVRYDHHGAEAAAETHLLPAERYCSFPGGFSIWCAQNLSIINPTPKCPAFKCHCSR